MWVSRPGVASPQPLDTSTLFHNRQSLRAPPAWLAGIRRRQPGVQKLKSWPRIPTVNTSHLLALKSAFTTSPRWPHWEGRWPQSHPPLLLCPLSSVPDTSSLRLRCLSQPAPRCPAVPSRGLALHLAQPLDRGELCWDCTTYSLGASGSRGGIPAALHPKPDTGRGETAFCCYLSRPFPQSTL